MVRKQAKLKNHPNVAAGEAPEHTGNIKRYERGGKHDASPTQHQTRRVLKSEIEEEQPKQKYCPFHERKWHELTECKAFGEKSLENKTQWIKKSGLCFRCLTAKHRANQCKEKITCDKCKSHLHQTLLHKEKESTRGASVKDLTHSTCLDEPLKLRQATQDRPPTNGNEPIVAENDPEVRRRVDDHSMNRCKTVGLGFNRFERASSWSRLKRAVARLIKKAKKYNEGDNSEDSTTTLRRAELVIIKAVQEEHFLKEMEMLRRRRSTTTESRKDLRVRKDVLHKSSIRRLNPFLDGEEVLRVAGRLHRSDLSLEERHPILIPKNDHVSKLMIQHYHQRVHHQGRLITRGKFAKPGTGSSIAMERLAKS